MHDLKQRYGDWALVTGGTSGIGAAIAEQLAAAGLNLVLVARTQASLDATAARLAAAHGVQTRTVAADLTRDEDTRALIDAVADLQIGLVVPCAAIELRGHFVSGALARHRALVQMDVVAPMVLAHHFGRLMAARGRGGILLVSSLSGWMAQPYMAHYGAAKAYVRALGESLHLELKGQGVDVTVLSPGPTDTPMAAATGINFSAMGMAIMQPHEVAAHGLASLGRRAHAVPGLRNRMMVFMMTRLMPRRLAGWMFEKMLGRALKVEARPALTGS